MSGRRHSKGTVLSASGLSAKFAVPQFVLLCVRVLALCALLPRPVDAQQQAPAGQLESSPVSTAAQLRAALETDAPVIVVCDHIRLPQRGLAAGGEERQHIAIELIQTHSFVGDCAEPPPPEVASQLPIAWQYGQCVLVIEDAVGISAGALDKQVAGSSRVWIDSVYVLMTGTFAYAAPTSQALVTLAATYVTRTTFAFVRDAPAPFVNGVRLYKRALFKDVLVINPKPFSRCPVIARPLHGLWLKDSAIIGYGHDCGAIVDAPRGYSEIPAASMMVLERVHFANSAGRCMVRVAREGDPDIADGWLQVFADKRYTCRDWASADIAYAKDAPHYEDMLKCTDSWLTGTRELVAGARRNPSAERSSWVIISDHLALDGPEEGSQAPCESHEFGDHIAEIILAVALAISMLMLVAACIAYACERHAARANKQTPAPLPQAVYHTSSRERNSPESQFNTFVCGLINAPSMLPDGSSHGLTSPNTRFDGNASQGTFSTGRATSPYGSTV